jgi:hypothetical protein
MIAKLLKPLAVAAMSGPVVLVTLPADANVEFDLTDGDLSDDGIIDVLCDGESYLAKSQELFEAVQPVGLAKP